MEQPLDDYEGVAALFKALAHPIRLAILSKTIDDEFCVHDIGEHIGRSQPNISQHLALLRERGLVTASRKGKRVCYRAADQRIAEIVRLATELTD